MIKGVTDWLSRYVQVMMLLCCCGFGTAALAQQEVENVLEGIDFRVGNERQARIIIQLQHPQVAVDIRKTADGLQIELLNTQVLDEQLYLADVKDFATNVKTIEVFRNQSSALLVAMINGNYSYDYSINGTDLHVEVKAAVGQFDLKSNPAPEQEAKKISINFQDIPVRHVLQLIADYNDFNLVVSDSVSGNLTLRLDGLPWQQVLDVILQVKGLDKRVMDNVVLIAPQAELDARHREELEKARLEAELGELRSEIVKVKFAKASEIASMIGGEGAISMLSSRGALSVDERTNALLIRDLQPNIDVIQELISALDIPVKQVQIEARIVTVHEGNLDELGVRWGYHNTNGSTSLGSSIEDNVFGAVPIDDMLNVNLAATSVNASSIAFQVAKLGSDMLLDLELSALQRESKAEVISSPRLITTNKKPAYIEQGTEIPYLESSSSGATSVAFKKAVLSLKVVPQITPDNRLVLDLSVTQDRPGDIVKTGTGEAVAINTQRIGTQVLVDNGETVVLGGIFQHSVTDAVDKVPMLGDLPLLGALFRRTYQKMGKSELLIFVTPKVVIQ
ncbi:type 4 pili secretin pilQ [Vibrio orientalis CIP 102891 = ATCC 33934]|uniref:Type 4 pili secretin pilQ n=1 Tax=Vibrio orientalis CIP 102891 = ATCC 33934 TaxID=675816 RepID=C9QNG5_VIBOR|nr:type IV pilus secretin PilQ family protein [Vibrio orientalis]EEX93492.1 type IV pilus biogenesis protein PilQ [Vibrio orientalis CIP 102891 = ATCC 33934]EGU50281.1 type 4 pili secretin pilQ [Vibrio orientalis CIP 102891 = ATCC 33934]